MALSAASISQHRLRFSCDGSATDEGASGLAFFWFGLFTGVNEVQGGGNTTGAFSVLTTVDPHSGFLRGGTEGAGAVVLAGVATGFAPQCSQWVKQTTTTLES